MIAFPHLSPCFSLGLVLGGDRPEGAAADVLADLENRHKPLLAADHGADHLTALGLSPTLILGDGDSQQLDHPGIPRVNYPQAKNFTDGAAAMAYALESFSGRIALCGADGGRTDMFLSNFLLPLGFNGDIQRFCFFSRNWEAAYCQSRCVITGAKGDIVSLIPLSAKAEGISLLGLEYPLHKETVNFADSRLMSNALINTEAKIWVANGTLLVLHQITMG